MLLLAFFPCTSRRWPVAAAGAGHTQDMLFGLGIITPQARCSRCLDLLTCAGIPGALPMGAAWPARQPVQAVWGFRDLGYHLSLQPVELALLSSGVPGVGHAGRQGRHTGKRV